MINFMKYTAYKIFFRERNKIFEQNFAQNNFSIHMFITYAYQLRNIQHKNIIFLVKTD